MKTVIKTPKSNQPNKPSLWVFKKMGTGYPVPDEVREFNNKTNKTVQQELKNIFVTKEVAKLAKEKGFNEICAGYYKINEENVFPNSNCDYEFFLGVCDNAENYIEAPTHFQLIQWIEETFFVRISRNNEGWWIVKEKGFEPTFIEDINMALEFALDTKKRTINQNGK